jgi:citrate synthase
MSLLQEKLRKTIPAYREQLKELAKTNGEHVVAQVTVGQLLGGQRGINALLCDTSTVPPDKGMIIRNHPVMELARSTPEEVYWLLLTGEMPNAA